MIQSTKSIVIFTDGSCKNKKKQKSCGSGVHFPKGEYSDISIKFNEAPLTNQRAELYAIYIALDTVKNGKYDKITIHTDSKYSISIFKEWIKKWKEFGWKKYDGKPILNSDLIIPIDNLINELGGLKVVKLEHVKAHTNGTSPNEKGNDIADKLAGNAASLLKSEK